LPESQCSPIADSPSFFRLGKVAAPALYHPPKSLFCFRLSKIGNKRYYSYYDEPDAYQIIEDLRENHYDDTEDKADDSSNKTQLTQSW
jgi:hypothetical protein